MNQANAVLMHGSCVAIGAKAVLITGPSGSGKSGLALQMIGLGAVLVADDGVQVTRVGTDLLTCAPEKLAGLIEARGLGILSAKTVQDVPLTLVVALDRLASARLPERQNIVVLEQEVELISGKNVPNLAAALLVKLGGT